ncbi:DNA primase [Candidatus Poriferisodalis sp.]|uniref:DNA primase n=1 Tax=Candidatus Poriferisodalis sp. TaxID=3101277 RepID=UPI003B0112B5
MSIRDSDVQRVREATDLVALIGRRVSLKRVGSRHVGLCPFHTEKTPSFSVNGAEGFYHCFGCRASGDAITFLRETEHLDFVEAVEQLAAAANIELTYDAPGAQRANQRRKELLDLLERAARFYHERLMSSPDAGEARAYLRRRGYDRETVVKWRLGYAPPLWDALCQHLSAPPDQLAAAGLAYADSRRGSGASGSADEADEAEPSTGSQRGEASDFFRDRVMFPISDASGRVVSFAGRVLPRADEPPPKGPKYKNTAGTAVYDKSKVLYGLHLAKQTARSTERIVVCEGHTDVIGCDLAGISEAVATCGTALTKQHAELLSRSAKRIVLAFDADAAGQTAAERVHQWEREFGLDIFVAALPPGSDPGDLAASNPPALRRALDEAQPLHAFRAERILERAELDSPSGRDRAADEAAEVLAVYPSDILRDTDFEPIAKRIPMEVDDLRQRVTRARERLTNRPTSAQTHADEVPPPPDPGDDYFEAELGAEWEPTHEPTGESVASPLARRIHVWINQAAQNRARRERELLEAAVVLQGDAAALITPGHFVSDTARAAFSRITSDPHWRRTIELRSADSAVAVGESEVFDDDIGQLLASIAAEGEKLSVEGAIDRIAKSWSDRVQGEIARMSDGDVIPFVHIEEDISKDERYRIHRAMRIRLVRRRSELRDVNLQVGAIQDLARLDRGEIGLSEILAAEPAPS